MSIVRRSFGSALQAAARIAAVLVGFAVAGASLNWLVLLGLVPIPGMDSLQLSSQQGLVSGSARVVLFGIVFPLAWVIAAQPAAFLSAAGLVYRRHKDDVLAGIQSVLRLELGPQADRDADHWLARLEELKGALEAKQPPILRPVVRLALRLSSLPEIEHRVRTGSGPMVTRITEAIADQMEEQMSEGASMWLWLVGIVNVAAMITAAVVAA